MHSAKRLRSHAGMVRTDCFFFFPLVEEERRDTFFLREAVEDLAFIEKEGAELELRPYPDLIYYFACSSCRVLVGWSQTSVGPKYWIGPG